MKYSLFWFLFGLALMLPFEVQSNKQAAAQSTKKSNTMEEIINNADDWVGKTITITGAIDERKNNHSFTLEGDNYFDSERILIINESGEPLPELPTENTNLRITGKVDEVKGGEYFDNPPSEITNEFETKPAIYADSIVLAPAPMEIIATPANFYEREVAVLGKVADVLDDNAFTLKEFSLDSDRNLLVLNTTGKPMPESGADVLIRGTVRSYNQDELEQEYGYDQDLGVYIIDESGSEPEDTAVLIVEEISPADVDLSEVEVDVTP